ILNEALYRDIMQDFHLINISGLPGHWMATDINMEHTVGEIKELLGAKGVETTWDKLGNISASINQLKKIKKKM
ncbi:hypothetical protein BDQ17DRAFT_1219654, partial [Cyathus striatus]